MKTSTILTGTLVCMLTLAGSASAQNAASTDAWSGTGASYDLAGNVQGTFKVALTNTTDSGGAIHTDGIVTLASGQQIPFWQERHSDGKGGFSLSTNDGNGGGRCFDNGMCSAYVAGSGTTEAISITKDGADAMRILVTLLDTAGKATGFVEQTLHHNE